MIIYSETINAFLSRARNELRNIMTNEMKLNVRRSRFEWKGHLVPFNVVVFEKAGTLGYFDHHTYQIGINRNLIYDEIGDILRHELAHFMTYLNHGTQVEAHGREFRETCSHYGWDSEVKRATTTQKIAVTNKVVEKIKKLLNLASSSNSYESKLATIKANELLLKYNLAKLDQDDDDEVCVKRVLSAKKNSPKYKTIYEILKTFMVSPVFNYGTGLFYLEVIGDRINVELADYVANFLDRELEKMWAETKKENPRLKGVTGKNSFMKGVAQGYLERIREVQKISATGKELVALDLALKKKLAIVYSRLSTSYSKTSNSCKESKKLGNHAGKNLSIHPGLKENKSRKKLLSFFK